eukprot:m.226995 g.226995  ORF g.226995 m.226995 type:complete len:702 (+) comp10847_c1_seq24:1078-3183(+)
MGRSTQRRSTATPAKDKSSASLPFGKGTVALLLAVLGGALFSATLQHVYTNDMNFTMLTDAEREMSFRSEQALYYSYYKDMVGEMRTRGFAGGLVTGVQDLISNKKTEYPSTVNLLKRFNIYPELLLSILYRAHINLASAFGVNIKDCYQVNDPKLGSVPVCVGSGVPVQFYVTAVFALQSLFMASLFLSAWWINDRSLLAGCFAVVLGFFNLGEMTRVQWTPPLRESFAFPFFMLQVLCLFWTIREQKLPSFGKLSAVALSTFAFALPWQFAHLALFLQVIALFGLYLLDYLPVTSLRRLVLAELVAISLVWVAQFGNTFLLTSPFGAFTLSALVVATLDRQLRHLDSASVWLRRILSGIFAVALMIGIKLSLAFALGIKDDAHIWRMLQAKFDPTLIDFDVNLYICSPEFDFMVNEYKTLSATLLLPTAAAMTLLVLLAVLRNLFSPSNAPAVEQPPKLSADVVFSVIQGILFFILAALIMRLKLFMTPFLILNASLVFHPQLLPEVLSRFTKSRMAPMAVIVVLLAGMSVQGIHNTGHLLNSFGEWNHPPMREMLEFVRLKTPATASFASTMPMTSAIKCVANRAIVNHPHYEDADLRERTFNIYKVFSAHNEEQVYNELVKYKTDYLVLDGNWCNRNRRMGCNMPEIYEHYYPELVGGKQFCAAWLSGEVKKTKYFERVFKNDVFVVIKLLPQGGDS